MTKRPIRRFLARAFLTLTGWKPDGQRPEPRRFVLIAAPHTSNWDFPYLIAFAEYFGITISWIGKDTLFRAPFGPVMRALGGISVRRDRSENRVKTLAELFREYEDLALVVPAEGTRSRVDYWKSGFYHIARTAQVPIVMSYLDFEKKTGGFGPAFEPTGDIRADMDTVRAFYAGKKGKFPEKFGPIRLREEGESDAQPEAPRERAD